MPTHPSEENTHGGLTEMVAKEPSSKTDSTASEHPRHKDDYSAGKAKASDFQATPGPAIIQSQDDVEAPASKDELRARAAELNKSGS
ncbi:MAG: hypothetical protein M1838_002035 [Thelocarpon superellum]|nr:MAG: hypothetical protein M1838_002035 [Thelocarpon superellum]